VSWKPRPGIDIAQHTITALHTWNRWATGHHVTIEDLAAAVGILHETGRSNHAALAAPVEVWGPQHGLRLTATVERTGVEIGIPMPDLW
jgi:hypothetical protein